MYYINYIKIETYNLICVQLVLFELSTFKTLWKFSQYTAGVGYCDIANI